MDLLAFQREQALRRAEAERELGIDRDAEEAAAAAAQAAGRRPAPRRASRGKSPAAPERTSLRKRGLQADGTPAPAPSSARDDEGGAGGSGGMGVSGPGGIEQLEGDFDALTLLPPPRRSKTIGAEGTTRAQAVRVLGLAHAAWAAEFAAAGLPPPPLPRRRRHHRRRRARRLRLRRQATVSLRTSLCPLAPLAPSAPSLRCSPRARATLATATGPSTA